MNTSINAIGSIIVVLLVSGCASAATPAANIAAAIDQALAHPDRPDADRERDDRSKPDQVLAFAGIRPGMVVWDIFGAGGYYSEIAARTVGDTGKVYLHNNKAYLGFLGSAADDRIANQRVPNLHALVAEPESVGLESESVDLALMIMTYHDIYWKTEGWDRDPEAFLASIARVLKPNGTLLIVDHAAPPGSGNSTTQDTHRIDPEWARKDVEGAGFIYEGSLDVLRNAQDDHTISVFDPAVRGKTDRFVFKFRRT